jgi:hypothetical protein
VTFWLDASVLDVDGCVVDVVLVDVLDVDVDEVDEVDEVDVDVSSRSSESSPSRAMASAPSECFAMFTSACDGVWDAAVWVRWGRLRDAAAAPAEQGGDDDGRGRLRLQLLEHATPPGDDGFRKISA